MNPILKNVLAVIAGFVVGSVVNMAIVWLSHSIVPPPAGVDPMDMESLKAGMHLFETKHFIGPFLAHAFGTLAGALTAASIAATYKMRFALAIGALFLFGGVYSTFQLPAPTWFSVLDIVGAYLPMGWLGGRLVTRKQNENPSS